LPKRERHNRTSTFTFNYRLRAQFGVTDANNGLHGSDSPSSAEKEIALFFTSEVSPFPEGVQRTPSHPRLISHEREFRNSSASAKQTPSAPVTEVTSTLAIIKPDAYGAGKKDDIVRLIKEHGFTILGEKEDMWSVEKAKEFYKEHEGKPFYDTLTEWMSSAPIYVLVLEKNDAVGSWRTLAGPTNSNTARETAPESIRAMFGTDGTHNAVHGSDSFNSSSREVDLVFSELKSLSKNKPTHPDDVPPPSALLERTVTIIKPEAYGMGQKENIMTIIRNSGFTILAQKEEHWSLDKAHEFYKEHEGKPFYEELTTWMSRYEEYSSNHPVPRFMLSL
jgi:nucleoside diphosphate kinase